MELTIYTDGGARGNPGEGAVGVVIETRNSKLETRIKKKTIKKTVGIVTNNEAEYLAVIEALSQISNFQFPISKIHVYLDSKLVCEQLSGRWKVKNARMQEFLLKAKTLENEIDAPISYTHIPREENKEADVLVNEALDELSNE